MKVALLTNYPKESGIGRYSFTLFEELNKLIRNTSFSDINVIDLYRLDRAKCGLYKFDNSGKRLIKFTKIDIVNTFIFRRFRLLNLFKDFIIGLDIPRNYNLYHITNQNISNLNYYKNIKNAIVTVHDLHFVTCPSYFSQKLSGKFIYQGIKESKFIISISKSTKNDIVQYLKIPNDKIRVIYHGVNNIFRPLDKPSFRSIYRKYGINSEHKYILHIGVDTLRKNFTTVLKIVYRLLKDHNLKNIKLIKVGKINNNTRNLIKSLNLERYVKVIDSISETDLVKLYNLAEIFVFPSLQEGFGFPVLEAMACGCPVVTSNTSSLPEVVGNAGIMVSPKDIKGFAEVVCKVLTDESFRRELSKKGLKRAKKFTWRRCAKETLKVYEEVLNHV